MSEHLSDIMNEILEQEYNIPNKSSPARKSHSAKCKVHKYIRFKKNSKTYRTDIYYCTRCPSTIPIGSIIGRSIECWKCEKAFNPEIGYFALKPICKDCREKKSDNSNLLNELVAQIERKII